MFLSPSLPTLPSRFRTGELDRLSSALKVIVYERAGHLKNGHSKNEGYWRVLPNRYPASATFDPEFMDHTLDLWKRLCELGNDKNSKSHRFSLTAVDIWMLILGVRMARHQQGHEEPKSNGQCRSKKWSRLLRKLDRLQKKARSAWLRSDQAGSFKPTRSRWAKHELWVRLSYGCLCRQPAIVNGRRRQRMYVQSAVEIAKQALAEAEIEAPDEKTLQYLVRLAFREIRRGRQPFSVGEVTLGGERVRNFLSYFIQEPLRKSGKLRFVSATTN